MSTLYLYLPHPRSVFLQGIAEHLHLGYKYSDGKDPVYQANFPLKRFPALLTEDGWALHEELALAQHMASLKPNAYNFYGETPRQVTETWKWLSLTNQDVMESIYAPQMDRVISLASVYDAQLAKTKYLTGAKPTLADAYSSLTWNRAVYLDWSGKEAEFVKEYPHIAGWITDMVATDPIVRVTTTTTHF